MGPVKALLDTSVLIAGSFSPPDGITEVAITSISYAELRFGIAAAARPELRVERSLRFDEIARQFGHGIPFDDRAALSYGHITELVLAAGRTPRGRIADLMIAAIAHANNAALITRDATDFVGIERMVTVFPG